MTKLLILLSLLTSNMAFAGGKLLLACDFNSAKDLQEVRVSEMPDRSLQLYELHADGGSVIKVLPRTQWDGHQIRLSSLPGDQAFLYIAQDGRWAYSYRGRMVSVDEDPTCRMSK